MAADLYVDDERGLDLFERIDMHKPKVADGSVMVKPFELGELERIVTGWSQA